jgi:hypothetical protein
MPPVTPSANHGSPCSSTPMAEAGGPGGGGRAFGRPSPSVVFWRGCGWAPRPWVAGRRGSSVGGVQVGFGWLRGGRAPVARPRRGLGSRPGVPKMARCGERASTTPWTSSCGTAPRGFGGLPWRRGHCRWTEDFDVAPAPTGATEIRRPGSARRRWGCGLVGNAKRCPSRCGRCGRAAKPRIAKRPSTSSMAAESPWPAPPCRGRDVFVFGRGFRIRAARVSGAHILPVVRPVLPPRPGSRELHRQRTPLPCEPLLRPCQRMSTPCEPLLWPCEQMSMPCEPLSGPCERTSTPCEPMVVPCERTSTPCEPMSAGTAARMAWTSVRMARTWVRMACTSARMACTSAHMACTSARMASTLTRMAWTSARMARTSVRMATRAPSSRRTGPRGRLRSPTEATCRGASGSVGGAEPRSDRLTGVRR